MMTGSFEWDLGKELQNILKHGVSFSEAREVFQDAYVIHLEDPHHSSHERRLFAIGRVPSGRVLTVRYTYRGHTIRILGAAEWRKWRKYYENARPK